MRIAYAVPIGTVSPALRLNPSELSTEIFQLGHGLTLFQSVNTYVYAKREGRGYTLNTMATPVQYMAFWFGPHVIHMSSRYHSQPSNVHLILNLSDKGF